MVAKVEVQPPRPSSPAAVIDAVSNSDFKKLFSSSPDDDVPHFATYSRRKGRELARELVLRLEEARRADADLLARKAGCGVSVVSDDDEEAEVTPASSVPDLKAIVSAASDDEVETKTTDSATDSSGDELETKTSDDEVEIKIGHVSEAIDEVETETTSASSARREPTLRPATLRQNAHRCLLWPKLMLLNCVSNVCEAVWIVLRDLWKFGGKPSAIFESNDPLALSSAPSFAGKKAPGYSCQLTFVRRFEDRERFRSVFEKLCEDAGMTRDMGTVRWNDDVELLHEYEEEVTDVSGERYVPNSRSYYAEGSRFKEYHVGVDMYESEGTTIMQAHLPGRAWDGTSCYNFVRELVHRYYSNDSEAETSPVFKAGDLIRMRDDVRQKMDNPLNILRWALRVPYNVYNNQSGLCWQKASAAADVDGFREIPKELCHVNFTLAQSRRLSGALKEAGGGVAPTAALVFAGVHAFRLELGELPFNVVMQASLQTRSFQPNFKERRFVGDWLIGVLHRVRPSAWSLPRRDYGTADAQKFYQDLIKGLDETAAAVRDGFYSRVLGKLKGGAAAFEKTPCFPGNSRLNDSLFFNNYGVRTVHPDAGCVGFNWSGAGKVGINCILVEGRLCCTVASTQLPLRKVEEIRDAFKEIVLAMMEGEDGDEAVERISEERRHRR